MYNSGKRCFYHNASFTPNQFPHASFQAVPSQRQVFLLLLLCICFAYSWTSYKWNHALERLLKMTGIDREASTSNDRGFALCHGSVVAHCDAEIEALGWVTQITQLVNDMVGIKLSIFYSLLIDISYLIHWYLNINQTRNFKISLNLDSCYHCLRSDRLKPLSNIE